MSQSGVAGYLQGNERFFGPGIGSSVGSEELPAFGQQQGGANAYANQLTGVGNNFLDQTAPNPGANQFAPSLATDQANFTGDQQGQQQSLAQLYAAATGTGPDVAADTMKAGLNQTQNQQTALAKSAGIGGAGALAARGAVQQNATAGINNANATAQVNAQQRAAALSAYNQAANQYAATSRAGQANQQQFGSAYGQMQEQQNAYNAQNQLAYAQMAQQDQTGQLTADSNNYTGIANVDNQQQLANNAANNSMTNAIIGGTVAAGGAFVAASDARLKRAVHSEGSLADAFLDRLHPYSFQYKRPADEPSMRPHGGRYLGVMAQDVERAPGGREMVLDTPRGKMLQGAPSIGAALAGIGRLNERVSMLEAESAQLRGKK